MHKYLLSILFLIPTSILLGQLTQEIKLNTFGLFKSELRPSFEIITPNKIGIEVEASLESQEKTYTSIDFNSTNSLDFKSIDYQNNRFEVAVAGKYYFSKTKTGYGFFAGLYTGLNFITKGDENFATTHLSLFNREAPENLYKKGINHIFYGLTGGYKFLIKEKIVAELSMKYVNIDYTSINRRVYDFDAAWFLKIGYRF